MDTGKEEVDIFKELKEAVGNVNNIELSPVQGMPLPLRDINKNELEELNLFFPQHDDCDCMSCRPWTY